MPEQISKYPDITLQVLKDSGARCGEGFEQKILTMCPPERFCALPGGVPGRQFPLPGKETGNP